MNGDGYARSKAILVLSPSPTDLQPPLWCLVLCNPLPLRHDRTVRGHHKTGCKTWRNDMVIMPVPLPRLVTTNLRT